MSKRLVSHSEVEKVMSCQAAHAFSYTGALTDGSALKPKQAHVRLREGRAWGRAVAALHSEGDDPLFSHVEALAALGYAVAEDALELRAHGFYDHAARNDMEMRLQEILAHYAQTSEPMLVTDPEIELRVPLPSRKGGRASTRYVFHGFLDGLTVQNGRTYIVEYKLRKKLSSLEQIALGRQYRRYAWAAERALGVEIAGVIVDERLNEAPKPARMLKNGQPSHAKDQLTTPELYVEACASVDSGYDPNVFTALQQRRWQVRHTIVFRRAEIEEAGRELVSAAQLIGQLDSGALFPVRNPSPLRCPGCAFRDICPNTGDTELIDLTFERVAAKRDREEIAA